MLVDSANVCGLRLQFADSTHSCGFHDSLSLINTYIIICSWIPLTVPNSAKFVACSTIFVAESESCLFSNNFEQYNFLAIRPWNTKQQRISKKGSTVASSTTNLTLACCGIRLHFTKRTVWPLNELKQKSTTICSNKQNFVELLTLIDYQQLNSIKKSVVLLRQ